MVSARRALVRASVVAALLAGGAAHAQDKGTLDPRPLPPLAHPDDPNTPARDLFGRQKTPAPLAAHVYGFYSHGCLAGGESLPADGPTWQVMRPSRNRNWGHPKLIAFLERFAKKVPTVSRWPGLLVGDMAQPRGGPMLNGHASHQIGLDADIWFRPMPDHRLSQVEREMSESTNLVRSDRRDVDPGKWSSDDVAVLKAAAQDPEVERIFVNPAIKKAVCRDAVGERSWLNKVRPFYGHDYHFHIRLACPRGEASCKEQEPVVPGDGCDSASLDWWFADRILHPRPPSKPPKPRPPMTMAQMPAECRAVATAR